MLMRKKFPCGVCGSFCPKKCSSKFSLKKKKKKKCRSRHVSPNITTQTIGSSDCSSKIRFTRPNFAYSSLGVLTHSKFVLLIQMSAYSSSPKMQKSRFLERRQILEEYLLILLIWKWVSHLNRTPSAIYQLLVAMSKCVTKMTKKFS